MLWKEYIVKTWKFYASGTDQFKLVVQAGTKEEALEKAEDTDGDQWTYVEDFGDWYIRHGETEEVKE